MQNCHRTKFGHRPELSLRLWLLTALQSVAHSFVANFVSYSYTKYYLNWFLFHIVIMKVIGVNFFLKQCRTVNVQYGAGSEEHRRLGQFFLGG